MIVPMTICTFNWQRSLLILFCGLCLSPIIFLRLLINPEFLTNYFIESNSQYGTLELVSIPSELIIRGIHDLASGLSKSQVLTILGKPRFKERKLNFPGCAPAIRKADEVWVYEIAPHDLVLLSFKGNNCSESRWLQLPQVHNYALWKTNWIQKFAIGQTSAELEASLGHCFIENPKFVGQVHAAAGNKSSADCEWKEQSEDVFIGYSSVIRLEMRNGRLAGAKLLAVFH